MPNKIAYLTIDDAPSASMDKKIDYLLRKKIPAVWFCNGELIEQRPGPAMRAIREGFVLGNHAYQHPHFSDLTLDECFVQIRRGDEVLEALYAQVGIERPIKCFRFPYGDKGGFQPCALGPYSASGWERKQALQAYLRQLGYRQPVWEHVHYEYYRTAGLQDDVDWFWTYDTIDWSIGLAEPALEAAVFKKVMARMDQDEPESGLGLNRGDSAEIVLMHDHAPMAAYFEPLVERLLEKGLTFKHTNW